MANMSALQISAGHANENTVEDHALYSATIHKIILTLIGVLTELLQITPTDPGVLKDTLRGLFVLGLIYVVLIVCEVKLIRNQDFIYQFIGHCSHLFGAFAACMLCSLIFPIFALVVVILYIFWFVFVVYSSFAQKKLTEDNQSGTDNSSNQHSPV